MSEWNNINDLDGWTKKLGELLSDARKAAEQKDLSPRLKVNERLMQFVENSWPNTPEIQALDDIATQAASALLTQTIEERLKSITERTGQYQKLGKQFEASAEVNKAREGNIRLEAITRFLDSSIRLVDDAQAVRKSLKDDAADKKLGEKIAEAIVAVEALRSSIGKRI